MCVYSSRSTENNYFINHLDKIIQAESNTHDNIIILGDFNIDILSDSHDRESLLDVMTSHNLQYSIDTPTRTTSTSKTAIDNIFTNIDSANYIS